MTSHYVIQTFPQTAIHQINEWLNSHGAKGYKVVAFYHDPYRKVVTYTMESIYNVDNSH